MFIRHENISRTGARRRSADSLVSVVEVGSRRTDLAEGIKWQRKVETARGKRSLKLAGDSETTRLCGGNLDSGMHWRIHG